MEKKLDRNNTKMLRYFEQILEAAPPQNSSLKTVENAWNLSNRFIASIILIFLGLYLLCYY